MFDPEAILRDFVCNGAAKVRSLARMGRTKLHRK